MSSPSTSSSASGSNSTNLESLWTTAQVMQKAQIAMSGGRKVKSEPLPDFKLSEHLAMIEQRFDITNVEYVGGGACGSVYSGLQKGSTGIKYSFKVVSATYNMPYTLLKFAKNTKVEINILQRLNHENVVKFYDCFKINEVDHNIPIRYLIKMQSLDITIGQAISVSKFNESQCTRLLTQIGGALKYMHQLGIAHHDIKTDNIMIERIDDLSELNTCTFKLIDFGVAKFYSSPIKSASDFSRRGTPIYSAPEKNLNGYNPFLTDSYAFGCVLLIALIGQDEFSAIWNQTQSLPNGVAINYLGDSNISQIVGRLLDNDPRHRFFVEEALELAAT